MLALLSGSILLLSPQRDRALLHQLQRTAGQTQGLEEGETIEEQFCDFQPVASTINILPL